jgi:threonine dehydratase|tara:strand:- start:247 stop:1218 length:972 start_codon:yes stop_codon:yes gene_type:complete
MDPLTLIPVTAIEEAADRIADSAIKTPLLPLKLPDSPCEIWLKAECLQPIGSFKIRGAANAMALANRNDLEQGVYTASAGNMAQGIAFNARRFGIPCRVIVPDTAPQNKLRSIERLGATTVPVPFDEWWSVICNHGHPSEEGFFIHPVCDPAVIAGNGTVGLEILSELPDVDSVIVPYGGGGLSCGISSALKALRPSIQVFAAEVETASPFAASLAAGKAVEVKRTPTFIDGIGGKGVLPEMWPLASSLLDGSIVVSVKQVCDAIQTMVSEVHLVAEGAGGVSLAAALTGLAGNGQTVAVISGGNLNPDALKTILEGNIPPSP